MTSVLHTSPSQTPVHAPANRARSAGTFVPGDVSFTSAGSGVSCTQSLACAVATSSAVARMAMAPPAITRDRSPPIACRCGPRVLAEESIGRELVLVSWRRRRSATRAFPCGRGDRRLLLPGAIGEINAVRHRTFPIPVPLAPGPLESQSHAHDQPRRAPTAPPEAERHATRAYPHRQPTTGARGAGWISTDHAGRGRR